VLTGHAFYFYCISNWGNPIPLIEPPLWSIVIQTAIGGFIGTVVKSCYAVRVWRFSKGNVWITSSIMFSIVVQYGFALWYTAISYHLRSLEDVSSIAVVANVALGLGVLTEVVTAASLCWYLRKLRTSSKHSDTLVNRLTLYAINTGLLTSSFSLLSLVTYDTMSHNFVFMGSYFIQCKLYANSFLATLNMRQPLQGQGMDDENETPVFRLVDRGAILPHSGQPDSNSDRMLSSGRIRVGIRREVSVKSDARPELKESYWSSDW